MKTAYVIAMAVVLLLISQSEAMDMGRIETTRNNLNSIIGDAQSSFAGESGPSFSGMEVDTNSQATRSIDTVLDLITQMVLEFNGLPENGITPIDTSMFGPGSVSLGRGYGGVSGIPPQIYHQELVDMLNK